MDWPPVDLCVPLQLTAKLDDICLPGGICLSQVWSCVGQVPHAADLALDYFSQIGPAMAPLKPLFDIIDTVVSLFRCVAAIPDAITSLDPSKLLECMPTLAAAVDNLLQLIPQISLPRLVRALLHNLALLLRGVAADFAYLDYQARRIADSVQRAAELRDQGMQAILACAQQNLQTQALSTAEALRGVGRIVLLINLLVGLFGGPEVPCFGALIGENLDRGFATIIELLTELADLLDEIAAVIPDPQLALTLALGAQRC
jgi:hypothetical protein